MHVASQPAWLPPFLSCPHDPEAAAALPAGKLGVDWPRERLAIVVVDIVVSFKSVGAKRVQVPRYLGRLIGGRLTKIETETIVPLATMCLA